MELRRDALGENLTILQETKGYRFGSDAVILATGLRPTGRPEVQFHRVAEFGAGHGAASLLACEELTESEIVAIERDEGLYQLLERNIEENDLQKKVVPILADVRALDEHFHPHHFDLIFFNPPFYRQGDGRVSPRDRRARAHHELHGTLQHFVDAAARYLVPQGYATLVIPPSRLVDLMAALQRTDFGLLSLEHFHASRTHNAWLTKVWLRRGARADPLILPPVIRRSQG